jgi:hypothetical protein
MVRASPKAAQALEETMKIQITGPTDVTGDNARYTLEGGLDLSN